VVKTLFNTRLVSIPESGLAARRSDRRKGAPIERDQWL
jgi:hypothetical protein